MKTISIIAAGLAIALPTMASAHDASPLYRELGRQSSLIEDGRQTGDLTFQEVNSLQGEQSSIRSMLMGAQYDGSFTQSEYRMVENALGASARHIRQERRNDHVAYWRVRGSHNSVNSVNSGEDELGYPRELSRDGQGPANGWGNGWGRRWGWGNRWGYGRQSWNSNGY